MVLHGFCSKLCFEPRRVLVASRSINHFNYFAGKRPPASRYADEKRGRDQRYAIHLVFKSRPPPPPAKSPEFVQRGGGTMIILPSTGDRKKDGLSRQREDH